VEAWRATAVRAADRAAGAVAPEGPPPVVAGPADPPAKPSVSHTPKKKVLLLGSGE
jgi:hypothetical protein